MTDGDWREERDEDGFPVANEDRVGDLFNDEYNLTWVCFFAPGLGYSWKQWTDPNYYNALGDTD